MKMLRLAIKEINKRYEFHCISFDKKSHMLNLACDDSRFCLDGIEDILSKHGVNIEYDLGLVLKRITSILWGKVKSITRKMSLSL
jgi:hypothetical protein